MTYQTMNRPKPDVVLDAYPEYTKELGTSMGPLAVAGAQTAGNIASSLISSAFNARQARKQMKFQERMSNTQYQRMVADLKKAGINPLWAVMGGKGSVPSGAMAQAVPARLDSAKDYIQAKLANLQLARTNAEVKVMENQASLNSALAGKALQEGTLANEKWQTEEKAREMLELNMNEARANAIMWRKLMESGKYAQMLLPFLKLLYQK